MLIDALKLFPLLLLANICIHSGVFFMSGQLFPEKLSFIYDKMAFHLRSIVAIGVFIGLGNIIVSKCFMNFSPALVTPMMIAIGIPIQIMMSIYILNGKYVMTLLPATLMVIIGCIWVNRILHSTQSLG